MADFKVIIKNMTAQRMTSICIGVQYSSPNHTQTKELSDFNENEGTLSAEFSFDRNIIHEGKQFVACVYGYDNE